MACEVAPAIDGRGRRLLTTTAAPAGALLHSEAPWAAVPTELASTCAATFAGANPTPRRLAACGRCKVVRYADRAAQAADWPAHKPECAALIAASPHTPSPTVRLAARCLWRAATAPSSSAPLDALESHWDDLPLRRQAAIAQVAALTRRYMSCGKEDDDGGEVLPLPSLPIIARLVARLAVNAHTITGGGAGLDRVGLGLYVGGGAMANHGHPPNAVQAFEGGVLQLRALSALSAGEEVTLAYTDAARPRPARRAALLEGYCFDMDAASPPLSPPPPPPPQQWAAPDGSITASATPTRPPCVQGDPEACTEVTGDSGGGGAVAWLEAVDTDDAAASFLLGDDDDEDEAKAKRPPPPPPPPVCRVVAWGAWATDLGVLARVSTALAAAERAADAVEALLDGRGGDSEAALALVDQGAAALAGLTGAGGPVPGPAHFTTGRLASATLRAALAVADFNRALAAARAATPLLDAALPAASPVRAHLYAERAKLAAWAGGNAVEGAAELLDREALAAAETAVAALRICSPAAPARSEMEALAANLRAEAEGRARTAAAAAELEL